MVLVDTHCHLDFHLFDADREKVVERAHQKGIAGLVNPGIDLQTSLAAVRLSETIPGLFAAAGIHPGECSTWNDKSGEELMELAQHPRVVAIGEIGLDYFHQPFSAEQQKQVLLSQLSIAASLELPVIIHSRKIENIIHDLERHSNSEAKFSEIFNCIFV